MRTNLKILALIILLFVSVYNLIAQNDYDEFGGAVNEMPLFRNEHPAKSFREYLQSQVKASSTIISDSVSGRIIIQFWIDTTGNLVEPKVMEGINHELDSLACQIALNSPKFTIPRDHGNKVKVALSFPILINMEIPIYNETKSKNKRRKMNKNYPQ